MCLQETLLTPSASFRLQPFYIIRKDITREGQRGICMLVRNNIIFDHIDLTQHDPAVEL